MVLVPWLSYSILCGCNVEKLGSIPGSGFASMPSQIKIKSLRKQLYRRYLLVWHLPDQGEAHWSPQVAQSPAAAAPVLQSPPGSCWSRPHSAARLSGQKEPPLSSHCSRDDQKFVIILIYIPYSQKINIGAWELSLAVGSKIAIATVFILLLNYFVYTCTLCLWGVVRWEGSVHSHWVAYRCQWNQIQTEYCRGRPDLQCSARWHSWGTARWGCTAGCWDLVGRILAHRMWLGRWSHPKKSVVACGSWNQWPVIKSDYHTIM